MERFSHECIQILSTSKGRNSNKSTVIIDTWQLATLFVDLTSAAVYYERESNQVRMTVSIQIDLISKTHSNSIGVAFVLIWNTSTNFTQNESVLYERYLIWVKPVLEAQFSTNGTPIENDWIEKESGIIHIITALKLAIRSSALCIPVF